MATIWTFLQTRVVCDVPATPGNFTGSAWCGDRLKVIEGAQRSGALQRALVSAAGAAAVVPNAMLRDTLARRTFAIVSHTNALVCWLLQVWVAWAEPGPLSDFVLCVATIIGPLVGAGGLPDVLYDTAASDPANRTRLVSLDYSCILVCNVLGRLAGIWMNQREPLSLAPLVSFLAAAHAGVLLLALLIPPAPPPWASADGGKVPAAPVVSVAHAKAMCSEVLGALRSDRLFFWNFVEALFSGMCLGTQGIQLPLLMARHPTYDMVFKGKMDFCLAIVSLPCPAIGLAMALRFGLRACICAGELTELVVAGLSPVASAVFGVAYVVPSAVVSAALGHLQAAAQSTIEHSKPHMRAQLRGRASALLACVRDLMAGAVGYALAPHFELFLGSWPGMARLWVLFYAFYIVEKAIWWRFQWPFFAAQADVIEREYRLEREKDAASKGDQPGPSAGDPHMKRD